MESITVGSIASPLARLKVVEKVVVDRVSDPVLNVTIPEREARPAFGLITLSLHLIGPWPIANGGSVSGDRVLDVVGRGRIEEIADKWQALRTLGIEFRDNRMWL
jgi:hypothetical protein